MDDEPGEADDAPSWYARGKGILSREEIQVAARSAVALRAAARDLARVGGARWALIVLREEIAEIEAPAKRGAGRPHRAARASDLALICLAGAASTVSAPKLAARLHSNNPGEYGATPDAIQKRIKTIRALSPEERDAMARAALIEKGRAIIAEMQANGEMTAEQADLFLECWAMMAEPERLDRKTRAFLADLMRRGGWGNQSG